MIKEGYDPRSWKIKMQFIIKLIIVLHEQENRHLRTLDKSQFISTVFIQTFTFHKRYSSKLYISTGNVCLLQFQVNASILKNAKHLYLPPNFSDRVRHLVGSYGLKNKSQI